MQGREKEVVSQIRALLKEGKKDEARPLLAGYLQRNPNDAEAWWVLSRIIGNQKHEIECLKRVLHLKPEHAKARRRMQMLKSPSKGKVPTRKKKKKISGWVIASVGGFFFFGILGTIYLIITLFSSPPAQAAPLESAQILPTSTPVTALSLPPTWTPTPNNTPMPTRTPFPTPTPTATIPAFTMVPLVEGISVGNAPPDFTLEQAGTGKYVSLSDYDGQPVIIVFFATWCGPCLQEVPALNATYNKYKEQGLVILAISSGESAKKINNYRSKHNLSYPVLIDSSGTVAGKYKLTYIPRHFMVARNGAITYTATGGLTESALDTHARTLLMTIAQP